MPVPHNLIHALPNLLILPRSLNISFSDQDQGFLYSVVGGAGSTGVGSTSGIGFDCLISNNSGVKITCALDGNAFSVLDGENKSITSRPYDRVQILDTTGATAPNAVDVMCMGLQMNDIVSYTKERPAFNIWE